MTVTAAAGCAWSVTASADWITLTAGGSGSGPGTVAYAVAVNLATASRSATLTIGGQSHAVTQEGRPPTICSYQLSPGSAEFDKDAVTGTFTVSAPGDCAWTAVSNASWLIVTSGNSGSGNGTVSYTVARNFDVGARTGTITLADHMFTVKQSGDVGGCQYSVAPVDLQLCLQGGSFSATVTTQTSCPWTATPNAAWLGIASGSSGSGSGVITITVSANYDAPRAGIIMVRWPTPTAGQNIRVAQGGCSYLVTRSAFVFTYTGGSGAFDVYPGSEPAGYCAYRDQVPCVWTVRSDVAWISIAGGMSRWGDDRVSFTVAMNDGASRVGRITVQDKVVVITQYGKYIGIPEALSSFAGMGTR